jgi:hypothetical protein
VASGSLFPLDDAVGAGGSSLYLFPSTTFVPSVDVLCSVIATAGVYQPLSAPYKAQIGAAYQVNNSYLGHNSGHYFPKFGDYEQTTAESSAWFSFVAGTEVRLGVFLYLPPDWEKSQHWGGVEYVCFSR